ncbi:MAG: tocopherol cyclase family protein [Planctomycetota bacterium]
MPISDNLSKIPWSEQTRSSYEVWYAIVNHPTLLKAFWFRYSLLARPNSPPEGRLWAIYFDEEDFKQPEVNDKQFLITQTFPWSEIQFSEEGGVQFGPHFLHHHRAGGSISGKNRQVSWNFTWTPAPQCHRPVANAFLYSLMSKSIHLTPNSQIQMNGELIINGEKIEFSQAPAHQGHTYGTQMPLGWIWGQCSQFNESDQACFEGVALYKKKSHPFPPARNSFYLHYQGKEYAFNRWFQILRTNQSQGTLPLWNFEARHPELWLRGNIRLRPAKFAHVAYLTPNDQFLFNHNDCLAQIQLTLYHPHETKPFQTLTSKRANLEFVFREGSRKDFEPHYIL